DAPIIPFIHECPPPVRSFRKTPLSPSVPLKNALFPMLFEMSPLFPSGPLSFRLFEKGSLRDAVRIGLPLCSETCSILSICRPHEKTSCRRQHEKNLCIEAVQTQEREVRQFGRRIGRQ